MSTLQIRIFDGTRQLFSAPAQFLVTITDGNKTQRVRNFYPDNDITFDLPFFDNFGDNYTVLVWADGYQQAGFTPVTLSDQAAKVLDIMLIPKDPGFSFAAARWDAVSASYPSSVVMLTAQPPPPATDFFIQAPPPAGNKSSSVKPTCSSPFMKARWRQLAGLTA